MPGLASPPAPTKARPAIPRNFKMTTPEPGVWVIHDVPVFYEALRDGEHYDSAWLARAGANALEAAKDGHLPPLHVHHRFRQDVTAFAAGTMRFVGVRSTTYKGRQTRAAFFDLIVTRESVAQDIMANRLLWRSPEVSFEEARIVSLALLDHEAPFFEGPMTTVQLEGSTVPSGTKAELAFSWCSGLSSPVVAFARSHGLTRALFREDSTMDPETAEKARLKQMGDDGSKKKSDGPPDAAPPADSGSTATPEAKEGETPDDVPGAEAGADEPASLDPNGQPSGNPLLSAIQGTAATIEQCIEALGFLQQLVEKMRGGGVGAASTPAPLPPTEGPSAQMTKPDAKVTQMQAELDALKAKDAARDLDAKIVAFADTSVGALSGTAVGADKATRGNILAFARKHGIAAAQEYVDGLKKHATPLAGSGRLDSLASGADDIPDDLKAFSAEGPEGYEQARQLYASWEALRSKGFCANIPFKTFVERERKLVAR